MKKSQVLAALALAFALGVVAPVAGVSAYVGGNAEGTITDAEKADLTKEINDAIAEAGKLEEYPAYEKVVNKVNATKKVIDPVVKAQKAALVTELEKAEDNYDASSYGIDVSTSGDLETLYARAKSARQQAEYIWQTLDAQQKELQKDGKTLDDATIAKKDNCYHIDVDVLTPAINGVDTALNNLTTSGNTLSYTDHDLSALVDAISDEAKADLKAFKKTDAYKNASGIRQLAVLLNYVEGLPKYDEASKLMDAIADANKAVGASYVSYADAQTILVALNKAIAKFNGTATEDPSEGTGEGSNNGNDGEGEGDAAGDTDKTPEAGDTGVIAAADGTASSTVAIVAGIATALTAAGAGVVAYRNARRQEA